MIPRDRRNPDTREKDLRRLLKMSRDAMSEATADEPKSNTPGLLRYLVTVIDRELAPKKRTR